MLNAKLSLSVKAGLILVFIYGCQAAPMDTMDMNQVPEDVTRFQHFVEEFEAGEIRLLPTRDLLRGKFPLSFRHAPPHSTQRQHREKREITETLEPGMGNNNNGQVPGMINEDAIIRQYVRNEITRIFSCYQRLRCGYTKAQAEKECQWLEHSSLYHQLMKILGIKNYPKKNPSSSQVQVQPQPLPPSQIHQSQSGQPLHRQRNVHMEIPSDISINPIHQNLQNGIQYGNTRPGQYLNNYNSNNNNGRNRRAYDSFYTEQKLAPISSST